MPTATDPPRLGLALSGGGFRASYFHLGLLARLAELDLLRHVQAISTVSGGAVIGAAYYLKLRTLLQQKPDGEITRRDYVDLVKDLQEQFHEGVQADPRSRAFAHLHKVLEMRRPNYSRSDRMAELYDRYFFDPLCERTRIPLRETRIRPQGESAGFHPFQPHADGGTANDHRRNKVPVLFINATTLNTGHNFRFTSTWMGERASTGSREQIDGNTLLRSFRFDDPRVPQKYRDLELSVAVAASTAVPNIFHPLALTELYGQPGSGDPAWLPQLVDGGVHDNQGSEALLDEHCSLLLVSDACGQLKDDPASNPGTIAVQLRTINALMDRVREEEFEVARLERPAELVFMHLRHELGRPLLECGDSECRMPAREGPQRVDARVQRLLANVRTDLDAFSDVEAFALMADGYLVAEEKLNDVALKQVASSLGTPVEDHREHWEFRALEPHLADPNDELLAQLRLARLQYGRHRIEHPEWHKTRRSKKRQRIIGATAAVIVAGFLVTKPGWVAAAAAVVLMTFGLAALVALALSGIVGGSRGRWITEHVGMMMGLILGIVAKVQIRWITPRFLRQGTVDTLGPPPNEEALREPNRNPGNV